MRYGFNERELSKEELFRHIDRFDVFYYYIEGFEQIGVPFCSELREDNTPSCSITERDGVLFYKDFGDDTTTDCIGYVMLLFDTDYWKALEQISVDFGLKMHIHDLVPYKDYRGEHLKNVDKKKQEEREKFFRVRRRRWRKVDDDYWGTYGIKRSTRDHFFVAPITHLWFNGSIIRAERPQSPLYAFWLDFYTYKVLAPYREQKWLSNAHKEHVQGYDQLPWIGNLVVITKSMKDVMVLYQLGIPAIAPHSETEVMLKRQMSLLKRRFGSIIILFDNDETGMQGASKYYHRYGLPSEFVPSHYGSKDISDLVRDHGMKEAERFVDEHIMKYNDEITI